MDVWLKNRNVLFCKRQKRCVLLNAANTTTLVACDEPTRSKMRLPRAMSTIVEENLNTHLREVNTNVLELLDAAGRHIAQRESGGVLPPTSSTSPSSSVTGSNASATTTTTSASAAASASSQDVDSVTLCSSRKSHSFHFTTLKRSALDLDAEAQRHKRRLRRHTLVSRVLTKKSLSNSDLRKHEFTVYPVHVQMPVYFKRGKVGSSMSSICQRKADIRNRHSPIFTGVFRKSFDRDDTPYSETPAPPACNLLQIEYPLPNESRLIEIECKPKSSEITIDNKKIDEKEKQRRYRESKKKHRERRKQEKYRNFSPSSSIEDLIDSQQPKQKTKQETKKSDDKGKHHKVKSPRKLRKKEQQAQSKLSEIESQLNKIHEQLVPCDLIQDKPEKKKKDAKRKKGDDGLQRIDKNDPTIIKVDLSKDSKNAKKRKEKDQDKPEDIAKPKKAKRESSLVRIKQSLLHLTGLGKLSARKRSKSKKRSKPTKTPSPSPSRRKSLDSKPKDNSSGHVRKTVPPCRMQQFLENESDDLLDACTCMAIPPDRKARSTITRAELGSLEIPPFNPNTKKRDSRRRHRRHRKCKESVKVDIGTMPIYELCHMTISKVQTVDSKEQNFPDPDLDKKSSADGSKLRPRASLLAVKSHTLGSFVSSYDSHETVRICENTSITSLGDMSNLMFVSDLSKTDELSVSLIKSEETSQIVLTNTEYPLALNGLVESLYASPAFDTCPFLMEPYCYMTLNTTLNKQTNKSTNTDFVWTIDYFCEAIQRAKPSLIQVQKSRKTTFKKTMISRSWLNKKCKRVMSVENKFTTDSAESKESILPTTENRFSPQKSKIPVFLNDKRFLRVSGRNSQASSFIRDDKRTKKSRIPRFKFTTPPSPRCEDLVLRDSGDSEFESISLKLTQSKDLLNLSSEPVDVVLYQDQESISDLKKHSKDIGRLQEKPEKGSPRKICKTQDKKNEKETEHVTNKINQKRVIRKDRFDKHPAKLVRFEPTHGFETDLPQKDGTVTHSIGDAPAETMFLYNADFCECTSTFESPIQTGICELTNVPSRDITPHANATTFIVNLANLEDVNRNVFTSNSKPMLKNSMRRVKSKKMLSETNRLASSQVMQQSVSLQVLVPSVHVDTNTSWSALPKFPTCKKTNWKSRLPLPIRRTQRTIKNSYTLPIEIDLAQIGLIENCGHHVNGIRSHKIANNISATRQIIKSLSKKRVSKFFKISFRKRYPKFLKWHWWRKRFKKHGDRFKTIKQTVAAKVKSIESILSNRSSEEHLSAYKTSKKSSSLMTLCQSKSDSVEAVLRSLSEGSINVCSPDPQNTWTTRPRIIVHQVEIVPNTEEDNLPQNGTIAQSDEKLIEVTNYEPPTSNSKNSSQINKSNKRRQLRRKKRAKRAKTKKKCCACIRRKRKRPEQSAIIVFDAPPIKVHHESEFDHTRELIEAVQPHLSLNMNHKAREEVRKKLHDYEEHVIEHEKQVVLANDQREKEREIKRLNTEAEQYRDVYPDIYTPVTRCDFGLTYFNFHSTLRNFMLGNETLRILTPCVRGRMKKAPKEIPPENVLPLLVQVGSQTCEGSYAGELSFSDIEIFLDRLRENAAIKSVQDYNEFQYEIFPEIDQVSAIQLLEPVIKEQSDIKTDIPCICDPCAALDEEFLMTFDQSSPDLEISVTFKDLEFIIVLPKRSFLDYCDCSEDVIFNNAKRIMSRLFRKLRKNKQFIRKIRHVLLYCKNDELDTTKCTDLAPGFIKGVRKAILNEMGTCYLDAVQIRALELKYRRQCEVDLEEENERLETIKEVEEVETQVSDRSHVDQETKCESCITLDEPIIKSKDAGILADYSTPNSGTSMETREPSEAGSYMINLQKTSFDNLLSLHNSSSCTDVDKLSRTSLNSISSAKSSRSCTSLLRDKSLRKKRNKHHKRVAYRTIDMAQGDSTTSSDKDVLMHKPPRCLKKYRNKDEPHKHTNQEIDIQSLYSYDEIKPDPIVQFFYACQQMKVRHPPILWVLAKKLITRRSKKCQGKVCKDRHSRQRARSSDHHSSRSSSGTSAKPSGHHKECSPNSSTCRASKGKEKSKKKSKKKNFRIKSRRSSKCCTSRKSSCCRRKHRDACYSSSGTSRSVNAHKDTSDKHGPTAKKRTSHCCRHRRRKGNSHHAHADATKCCNQNSSMHYHVQRSGGEHKVWSSTCSNQTPSDQTHRKAHRPVLVQKSTQCMPLDVVETIDVKPSEKGKCKEKCPGKTSSKRSNKSKISAKTSTPVKTKQSKNRSRSCSEPVRFEPMNFEHLKGTVSATPSCSTRCPSDQTYSKSPILTTEQSCGLSCPRLETSTSMSTRKPDTESYTVCKTSDCNEDIHNCAKLHVSPNQSAEQKPTPPASAPLTAVEAKPEQNSLKENQTTNSIHPTVASSKCCSDLYYLFPFTRRDKANSESNIQIDPKPTNAELPDTSKSSVSFPIKKEPHVAMLNARNPKSSSERYPRPAQLYVRIPSTDPTLQAPPSSVSKSPSKPVFTVTDHNPVTTQTIIIPTQPMISNTALTDEMIMIDQQADTGSFNSSEIQTRLSFKPSNTKVSWYKKIAIFGDQTSKPLNQSARVSFSGFEPLLQESDQTNLTLLPLFNFPYVFGGRKRASREVSSKQNDSNKLLANQIQEILPAQHINSSTENFCMYCNNHKVTDQKCAASQVTITKSKCTLEQLQTNQRKNLQTPLYQSISCGTSNRTKVSDMTVKLTTRAVSHNNKTGLSQQNKDSQWEKLIESVDAEQLTSTINAPRKVAPYMLEVDKFVDSTKRNNLGEMNVCAQFAQTDINLFVQSTATTSTTSNPPNKQEASSSMRSSTPTVRRLLTHISDASALPSEYIRTGQKISETFIRRIRDSQIGFQSEMKNVQVIDNGVADTKLTDIKETLVAPDGHKIRERHEHMEMDREGIVHIQGSEKEANTDPKTGSSHIVERKYRTHGDHVSEYTKKKSKSPSGIKKTYTSKAKTDETGNLLQEEIIKEAAGEKMVTKSTVSNDFRTGKRNEKIQKTIIDHGRKVVEESSKTINTKTGKVEREHHEKRSRKQQIATQILKSISDKLHASMQTQRVPSKMAQSNNSAKKSNLKQISDGDNHSAQVTLIKQDTKCIQFPTSGRNLSQTKYIENSGYFAVPESSSSKSKSFKPLSVSQELPPLYPDIDSGTNLASVSNSIKRKSDDFVEESPSKKQKTTSPPISPHYSYQSKPQTSSEDKPNQQNTKQSQNTKTSCGSDKIKKKQYKKWVVESCCSDQIKQDFANQSLRTFKATHDQCCLREETVQSNSKHVTKKCRPNQSCCSVKNYGCKGCCRRQKRIPTYVFPKKADSKIRNAFYEMGPSKFMDEYPEPYWPKILTCTTKTKEPYTVEKLSEADKSKYKTKSKKSKPHVQKRLEYIFEECCDAETIETFHRIGLKEFKSLYPKCCWPHIRQTDLAFDNVETTMSTQEKGKSTDPSELVCKYEYVLKDCCGSKERNILAKIGIEKFMEMYPHCCQPEKVTKGSNGNSKPVKVGKSEKDGSTTSKKNSKKSCGKGKRRKACSKPTFTTEHMPRERYIFNDCVNEDMQEAFFRLGEAEYKRIFPKKCCWPTVILETSDTRNLPLAEQELQTEPEKDIPSSEVIFDKTQTSNARPQNVMFSNDDDDSSRNTYYAVPPDVPYSPINPSFPEIIAIPKHHKCRCKHQVNSHCKCGEHHTKRPKTHKPFTYNASTIEGYNEDCSLLNEIDTYFNVPKSASDSYLTKKYDNQVQPIPILRMPKINGTLRRMLASAGFTKHVGTNDKYQQQYVYENSSDYRKSCGYQTVDKFFSSQQVMSIHSHIQVREDEPPERHVRESIYKAPGNRASSNRHHSETSEDEKNIKFLEQINVVDFKDKGKKAASFKLDIDGKPIVETEDEEVDNARAQKSKHEDENIEIVNNNEETQQNDEPQILEAGASNLDEEGIPEEMKEELKKGSEEQDEPKIERKCVKKEPDEVKEVLEEIKNQEEAEKEQIEIEEEQAVVKEELEEFKEEQIEQKQEQKVQIAEEAPEEINANEGNDEKSDAVPLVPAYDWDTADARKMSLSPQASDTLSPNPSTLFAGTVETTEKPRSASSVEVVLHPLPPSPPPEPPKEDKVKPVVTLTEPTRSEHPPHSKRKPHKEQGNFFQWIVARIFNVDKPAPEKKEKSGSSLLSRIFCRSEPDHEKNRFLCGCSYASDKICKCSGHVRHGCYCRAEKHHKAKHHNHQRNVIEYNFMENANMYPQSTNDLTQTSYRSIFEMEHKSKNVVPTEDVQYLLDSKLLLDAKCRRDIAEINPFIYEKQKTYSAIAEHTGTNVINTKPSIKERRHEENDQSVVIAEPAFPSENVYQLVYPVTIKVRTPGPQTICLNKRDSKLGRFINKAKCPLNKLKLGKRDRGLPACTIKKEDIPSTSQQQPVKAILRYTQTSNTNTPSPIRDTDARKEEIQIGGTSYLIRAPRYNNLSSEQTIVSSVPTFTSAATTNRTDESNGVNMGQSISNVEDVKEILKQNQLDQMLKLQTEMKWINQQIAEKYRDNALRALLDASLQVREQLRSALCTQVSLSSTATLTKPEISEKAVEVLPNLVEGTKQSTLRLDVCNNCLSIQSKRLSPRIPARERARTDEASEDQLKKFRETIRTERARIQREDAMRRRLAFAEIMRSQQESVASNQSANPVNDTCGLFGRHTCTSCMVNPFPMKDSKDSIATHSNYNKSTHLLAKSWSVDSDSLLGNISDGAEIFDTYAPDSTTNEHSDSSTPEESIKSLRPKAFEGYSNKPHTDTFVSTVDTHMLRQKRHLERLRKRREEKRRYQPPIEEEPQSEITLTVRSSHATNRVIIPFESIMEKKPSVVIKPVSTSSSDEQPSTDVVTTESSTSLKTDSEITDKLTLCLKFDPCQTKLTRNQSYTLEKLSKTSYSDTREYVLNVHNYGGKTKPQICVPQRVIMYAAQPNDRVYLNKPEVLATPDSRSFVYQDNNSDVETYSEYSL